MTYDQFMCWSRDGTDGASCHHANILALGSLAAFGLYIHSFG